MVSSVVKQETLNESCEWAIARKPSGITAEMVGAAAQFQPSSKAATGQWRVHAGLGQWLYACALHAPRRDLP
jgi:hypothetical protein